METLILLINMELGQLMYGNPTGEYPTKNYQDALILSLLNEMDRVFWNKNQKEWDRFEDPCFVGVVFRPYYWGDDETKAALPNLMFAFSDQEIRWYKHPGRSMSVKFDWSANEWLKWYEDAYQLILANDTK